jgi:uncharacterized protein (TIGR00730 family)
MQRLCVFTGSSLGRRQEYQQAARELGQALVAHGLGLVYGGAVRGLMGVIADTVLAHGGEVIGVIPRAFTPYEIAHQHLTKLYEVGSMHERKALMADLSDGFIALPGGLGTFEELLEITTWAKLGFHTKPIGLLNVAGYFQPLLAMIQHAADEGFLPPIDVHLLLTKEQPADLLDAFATYTPLPIQSGLDGLPER